MQQTQLTKAHSACISGYLAAYAEPESLSVSPCKISQFDTVIVIPVYDEAEHQLQTFLNINFSRRVLMIWVFNAPESALDSSAHRRTQALMERFILSLNAQALSEHCHYALVHTALNVLIVDRCQQPIPDKQGVGLARKIGSDLALCLIYQQFLQTDFFVPWIYSTDADASLPDDYAMLEDPAEGVSACIHPFRHIPENGFELAMHQYEFSLHYYVDRLRFAGSPYAFHTIGSLIAFTPLAYAQVRGFPKRSGAEDFYLLNKLAKVGKVATLDAPVIELSGRPSHRVPFGTGPALIRISADASQQRPFQIYHPRIFDLLHVFLASVNSLSSVDILSSSDRSTSPDQIGNSFSDSAISLLSPAIKLLTHEETEVLKAVLSSLGWQKQQPHLTRQKNIQAYRQAFHTWFDAFLTLRFVHEIRDRLYPNIDLSELPKYFESAIYRGSDIDYPAWFEKLGIST